MSKTLKKVKYSIIDLRKRSNIVVETADIDKMNQTELSQRIKQLNTEIKCSRRVSDELDFMIIGPQKKALKQMKAALRERLRIKWER